MTPRLQELQQKIDEAMLGDRFRLRRRLAAFKSQKGQEEQAESKLAQLAEAIDASRQRRLDRAVRVPAVQFANDLPIHQQLEEIRNAIEKHPVVVVCGETGSGKSTQLPKLCLSMGRGIEGMIGHTQPRRIAARSIAARLAEELHTSVGADVGFKVRFTDATQPNTYIKLMTDGILLAETQNDRYLEQYDTLIIDEAHERSLNIDFLLGYVQRLLPKRPELRLIVTSATIDAARFSEFFTSEHGPAPVIEVSGRAYPVELRYRPVEAEEDAEAELQDSIVSSVGELLREGQGDILVFLATERDIRDVAKLLRGAFQRRESLDILPLYARLSNAEQQRIFQPHKERRVVLATNVAESSLTVPNIYFVIDTGLA